jgi:hypothetical protein
MTDEPGWITKRDAATRAGVDERTIERKARAGKLNARARPGFPTLYSEADVEKLAQASSQEVRTGVLTAVAPGPTNGNGAVAHQRTRTATFEEVFVEVLHALRAALEHGPTGPTEGPTGPTRAPTGPTLWVSLNEAAAVTGRSRPYLRRRIAAGTLYAEKDRGWKIRRKDLEQL